IGLTTTLKNAWTTSRQVNFFWVANFNLKFGQSLKTESFKMKLAIYLYCEMKATTHSDKSSISFDDRFGAVRQICQG
ncbi:hypothetical protein Q7W32_03905, partial [Streptococcus suis]|nr:hypothetical protein [Streptococcus suis]